MYCHNEFPISIILSHKDFLHLLLTLSGTCGSGQVARAGNTGEGGAVQGGVSRRRFRPISVPERDSGFAGCQLSFRSETRRFPEFSDQQARESFEQRTCGGLLSAAAAAQCSASACVRVSAGERLCNPRQCSETVRP